MFKPYGPKKFNAKHLRHELREPIKEHLIETMGVPKIPKRKRRF